MKSEEIGFRQVNIDSHLEFTPEATVAQLVAGLRRICDKYGITVPDYQVRQDIQGQEQGKRMIQEALPQILLLPLQQLSINRLGFPQLVDSEVKAAVDKIANAMSEISDLLVQGSHIYAEFQTSDMRHRPYTLSTTWGILLDKLVARTYHLSAVESVTTQDPSGKPPHRGGSPGVA